MPACGRRRKTSFASERLPAAHRESRGKQGREGVPLDSTAARITQGGGLMRFLTLAIDQDGLGAVVGQSVVAVRAVLSSRGEGQAPARMEDLFSLSDDDMSRIWDGVQEAAHQGMVLGELDEDRGLVRGEQQEIRVLAPLPELRRNILCIGKNYRAHVNEVRATAIGAEAPEAPVVFTKATTALNGPGSEVPAHSNATSELDYEGEVAVVVGRGGTNISKEDAWDHVFGLTLINDITGRDLQRRHRQFFLGKSLDGCAPMGPVLVPRQALPEVNQITLTTKVNGELRQEGSLADLIFDIPKLIESLSAGMTLLPGDIIATGTPAGVGAGFDPPRFLVPGDVVEVASPVIGRLVSTVTG